MSYPGVQPIFVPMTPDKTVAWHLLEVPTLGGDLYHASDAPGDLPEQVLAVAANKERAFVHPTVLQISDTHAVVADRELVYKVGFVPFPDQVLGLSAVRANVALHEGLQRISQTTDKASPIGPHYYAAPRMHAVYMPHDTSSRAVVVMSQEQGRIPNANEVPAPSEQAAHYAAAVGACGLSGNKVYYDNFRKNLLISPDEQAGKLRIVKLDILAAEDYAKTGLF